MNCEWWLWLKCADVWSSGCCELLRIQQPVLIWGNKIQWERGNNYDRKLYDMMCDACYMCDSVHTLFAQYLQIRKIRYFSRQTLVCANLGAHWRIRWCSPRIRQLFTKKFFRLSLAKVLWSSLEFARIRWNSGKVRANSSGNLSSPKVNSSSTAN